MPFEYQTICKPDNIWSFEYRTICKPGNFWSFEYQTSPLFRWLLYYSNGGPRVKFGEALFSNGGPFKYQFSI